MNDQFPRIETERLQAERYDGRGRSEIHRSVNLEGEYLWSK